MPGARCRSQSNFRDSQKRRGGAIFKERLIPAVIKRWNSGEVRRTDRQPLLALTAFAVTMGFGGCSLHTKPAPQSAASPTDQSADSTAPSEPEAKIQISYSQP